MIVTVSLGLEYVFICGERISVIHVAELINQIIHDTVVPKLLFVDHIGPLLDDVIETDPIGQLELIIEFEFIDSHTLFLNDCSRSISCRVSRIAIYSLFLIVNFLNSRPQFLLPDVREETSSHEPVSLASLCDGIVTETLQGVAELVLLQLLSRWQGQWAVRVLRCRVDLVNQVWPVLITRHVSLELVILVLRSIEISCE